MIKKKTKLEAQFAKFRRETKRELECMRDQIEGLAVRLSEVENNNGWDYSDSCVGN